MKTIKRQIKFLALAIVLIFSIGAYAQKEIETSNVFVRVYNLEGKKISKGTIVFINDSIIALKKTNKKININMKDIGSIRTKRSEGNNVLIGAVTGAVFGGGIGVATSDSSGWLGYSAGEGALVYGVLGTLAGGAIGGLSSIFKEPKTYVISANKSNWKEFHKLIEQKLLH